MPRNGTATRTRILDAAETLVIDNGFAATSIDQVLAASGSSKGAFFHHFTSKLALARALVERYAEADVAHLRAALAAVEERSDPVTRAIDFVRVFEDSADELMAAQSSCLYLATLTEQELINDSTVEPIRAAILAWRTEFAALLRAALSATGRPDTGATAPEALADHLFVTFEGAFLLCRSTGEPQHMRRQLGVVRGLLESLLDG